MGWKCVAMLFALCLSTNLVRAQNEPSQPHQFPLVDQMLQPQFTDPDVQDYRYYPLHADPVKRAREILEASARAYRGAPALRDTITYVVRAPGAANESKTLEYGFGAGADAFVKDPLLEAVAVGDKMFLTRSDAPKTYVAMPYHGDFGATLNGIAGDQGSLLEPPQLAMRTGKKLDDWIDALRFKLLAPPLRVLDAEQIRLRRGKYVDEIRFAAPNGMVVVRIDSATHLFTLLAVEMRPPGASKDQAIHIDATFAPQVLPSAAGVVHFEPGDRTAVPSPAGLGTKSPGAPAPGKSARNY